MLFSLARSAPYASTPVANVLFGIIGCIMAASSAPLWASSWEPPRHALHLLPTRSCGWDCRCYQAEHSYSILFGTGVMNADLRLMPEPPNLLALALTTLRPYDSRRGGHLQYHNHYCISGVPCAGTLARGTLHSGTGSSIARTLAIGEPITPV